MRFSIIIFILFKALWNSRPITGEGIERALSTAKSVNRRSYQNPEDDMPTTKNYSAHSMPLPWKPKENVTYAVSSTAYLHCKVHNLGNKTVSWIRKKDLHLLSVGTEVFTTDRRFQVYHIEKAHLWILEIRKTRFSDAGIYECQTNAHPEITNIFRLHILALEAHIIEGSILYIEKGTPIDLNCILKNKFGNAFLNWHKQAWKQQSKSRVIQVITKWRPWSSTRLLINKSQKSDSGFYTCDGQNVQPASINVQVLDRVKTFAKDSGQKTKSYIAKTALGVILILICILLK